jgi:predicted ATPase
LRAWITRLTGAGGAGKTRLAVEIAARITPEYADGVWCVDLAPIIHPDLVPVTVARALGLPATRAPIWSWLSWARR